MQHQSRGSGFRSVIAKMFASFMGLFSGMLGGKGDPSIAKMGARSPGYGTGGFGGRRNISGDSIGIRASHRGRTRRYNYRHGIK